MKISANEIVIMKYASRCNISLIVVKSSNVFFFFDFRYFHIFYSWIFIFLIIMKFINNILYLK